MTPQGDVQVTLPDRLVRWAVLATATAAIGLYVVVAVRRLDSPVELEWMEGGTADQVAWLRAGRPLYGPPSLEHTPFLYTPLYLYVSALVSIPLGPGWFPLRVVSFVSSLVAFAALAALVFQETRTQWSALVAAGTLAACFGVTGFWFDLARVDSMALAMLLIALVATRRVATPRGAVVAGALFVVAWMTKQEALLPAVAVVPWLWRHRGRRCAVAYMAAGVLSGAAALLALQLSSSGWFTYYVIELPASHEWLSAEWSRFWTRDMFRFAPVVVLVAMVGIAASRDRHGPGGGRRCAAPGAPDRTVAWSFVGPVAISLVVTSLLGRVHSGGYDNVLMPACAAAGLLAAVSLARLHGDDLHGGGLHGDGPGVAALVVTLTQLAILWSWPHGQVPADAAERDVARVVERLRQLDGPVYLPGHGDLLRQAGHRPNAHSAALADVLRGPEPHASRLRAELRRSIRDQRFSAVIVDSDPAFTPVPGGLGDGYRRTETLFPPGDELLPVTGTQTGPLTLWIPRAPRS